MTLFRLKHETCGGHVHVRVFAGKGTLTLANCGTLVMRVDEWKDFVNEMHIGQYGGGSIEIVSESVRRDALDIDID